MKLFIAGVSLYLALYRKPAFSFGAILKWVGMGLYSPSILRTMAQGFNNCGWRKMKILPAH